MEDKQPKVLDILRLIVAVLTLICSLVVAVSLWLAIRKLISKDDIGGLVIILLIPLFIGVIVYFIISIKWIKKYNKVKRMTLLERNTNVGETIIKIIISIAVLTYTCIPLAVYWGLDLIEAIKRNNFKKKWDALPKPEFKTNETHPITDNKHCKNCGKEVDYRYARFCEHCGTEIEFRK